MTDAHAVKKSATKKHWLWKLLLSGTCLTPLSLSAAQVEGIITDADAEWPLAHVAVSTGRAGTITDSLGRYELELPPGRYRVEVSRIGYGPQSQQIELLAGQNLQLDFALNPQALPQAATLITATGRPKSATALTVPVAIVPREAIELSSAENVAGLLEDVAGLNVHSSLYGYLGSPSGVMIQGIDPKRVLILVDGERVIGGPGGVIDLDKLPVSNVERIEVVKGPHSALYGSEAMGGVVHILTRSPQERSGDVRFSLGSGGLTALEGQAALTHSNLSASLTASRTALEALDRSPDDPDTDIDAYTQCFTQGKLRWEARPNLLLQGSARWLAQNEEGVSSQYFAPLDKTYVWRFPDQMQRVDLGTGAEWQWAEGSTAHADVFRTYFDKLSSEELIGSRQARDRSTDNVLTKYQLRTTHLLRRTHILTTGLKHTCEELEVSLKRTLPLGRATAHGGSAAVARRCCGGLHPRRLASGGKHRRRVGCPLSVALALRVPSDAESLLCPATFRGLEGAGLVRRWLPRSLPKGTPFRLRPQQSGV